MRNVKLKHIIIIILKPKKSLLKPRDDIPQNVLNVNPKSRFA